MPGALVVPITAVHNWGEIIHVDPTLIAEGFDAKFCKNTNCGTSLRNNVLRKRVSIVTHTECTSVVIMSIAG